VLCPTCASTIALVINVSGALAHLAAADTAFAAVSRAPLAKLETYRARMGWAFPSHAARPQRARAGGLGAAPAPVRRVVPRDASRA
jgi:predicted dithiol-disulfide oxidoreductase (DUF899 family)